MNEDSNNAGTGIAGKAETTWLSMRDCIPFAAGAPLAPLTLFDNTTTRNKVYRNYTFAIAANQKNLYVKAMRFNHNYNFDPVNTEPQGSKLQYFEESSLFRFSLIDKKYDEIAVAQILPYSRLWDGTDWQFTRREKDIFWLPEQIFIPTGGNAELEFIPASTSLVLSPATGATPVIYDAGFNMNQGYMGWVNLVGKQERPIG